MILCMHTKYENFILYSWDVVSTYLKKNIKVATTQNYFISRLNICTCIKIKETCSKILKSWSHKVQLSTKNKVSIIKMRTVATDNDNANDDINSRQFVIASVSSNDPKI